MNRIVHPLISGIIWWNVEKAWKILIHGQLLTVHMGPYNWSRRVKHSSVKFSHQQSKLNSFDTLYLMTTHNMQPVLTSANCDSIGTPYRLLSSNKSSTYSVLSICRKMLKSWSVSWIATSTAFSCRKCTWLSLTRSGAISSGTKVSVVPFVFR